MKEEIIKNKNDEVFCYPDTLLNKFIPQGWQIQIMQTFISTHKKKISFYTGENHKTFKSMGIFKKRLNEEKKLHGFIFFSYLQFCYDKKKDEDLIKKSIDKNFTIYFAREKLIIDKKNYLQKKKDLIFFKETNKKLISVILDSFL
jgi:hypothetical protein